MDLAIAAGIAILAVIPLAAQQKDAAFWWTRGFGGTAGSGCIDVWASQRKRFHR
jgi:hypothetical protein